MNKLERMKAVFAGQEPDQIPAGFWFHNDAELSAEETAEAHLKLYHALDNDVIKIMDDSFGHMLTEGIAIEKASDWRTVTLPGRDCFQYRRMEQVIRILKEKTHGEVMLFPTVWSAFKIASFTYVFSGSTDQAFMRHCTEDPGSVLVGVQKINDVLLDWVKGYLDAGASGVYYTAQFSEPQRFDADTWGRLVKPYDLQLLNHVKGLGGYVMLHLCGEAEHGFRSSPERYRDYPCDIINWDVHRTDMGLKEGHEYFGASVLGGMDNHGLMLDGTPEEIAREVEKVIAGFGRKGLMIGADCTVPGDIEIGKLQAAVNAAKASR